MTRSVSAAVFFVVLVVCESAAAQVRTAHLTEPACARIPFAHRELFELLQLELAADGIGIVSRAADVELQYDASDCAHVRQLVVRAGALDPVRLDVSGGPRALALYFAEALRARSPSQTASGTSVEPADPPEPPPLFSGAFAAHGVFGLDNLAWLAGARLELSMRMPFHPALRLRAGTGISLGMAGSSPAHLRAVEVSLMPAYAFGTREQAFEVGVRVAYAHGSRSYSPLQDYRADAANLALLSLAARSITRIAGGLSVFAELELGGPVASDAAPAEGSACSDRWSECGLRGVFVATRTGLELE